MQIAIVDDRQEERTQLKTMAAQYCERRNAEVAFEEFSSGEALMEGFEPGRFACIFMDIYMDGMDGMDTARRIYRMDPECRLIFCTSSISHAVESYEVRAAWYLTKPISEGHLSDAMDAALGDILRSGKSLELHVRGGAVRIRFADICFMDCSSRQAQLHLHDRTLHVDENVAELMGLLTSDQRFLVCNRNTVVNMDHVERAEESDFLMKNGVRVPLRQRGRAALKKTWLMWTLRELRREERI